MWEYDRWPSGEPYDWGQAARGDKHDSLDFHVDLGCGAMKKGRIGVDINPGPDVDIVAELGGPFGAIVHRWRDAPGGSLRLHTQVGLPFGDGHIESIIAYHSLEHVADLFPLFDECWRVLKPDGVMRAVVPLFPSYTSVLDLDHKHFFVEFAFEHLLNSGQYNAKYLQHPWEIMAKDVSPPTPLHQMFTPVDQREMRITLRAEK